MEKRLMTNDLTDALFNSYARKEMFILYCENCGKVYTTTEKEDKTFNLREFRDLKCCKKPSPYFLVAGWHPKFYPTKIYTFREMLSEEGLVKYLLRILEPKGD